jgi:hypothetical protein
VRTVDGAVTDPVGRADRLRSELADAIESLVGDGREHAAPAGGPDGEPDSGGGPGGGGRPDGPVAGTGDIYVGWFAALEAQACPARYREQGEEGWGFPGWTAATAAPAIARAALRRHLDADRPLQRAAPLPEPVALVKEWIKGTRPAPERGVAEWVAERLDAGDAADLAAATAGATRWLTGFVRVVGWPAPDGLALFAPGREGGGPWPWRPGKRSPVKVASGADGRLGRTRGSGDFAMLVHRPTTGGEERLRDRAAYEATAAALAIGIVPAQVVVTAGDTGERARVAVDESLLATGAALVTGVVRERARATRVGHEDADATPSPGCRHCPQAERCTPGQAWLAGPGRWRNGLPTL